MWDPRFRLGENLEEAFAAPDPLTLPFLAEIMFYSARLVSSDAILASMKARA